MVAILPLNRLVSLGLLAVIFAAFPWAARGEAERYAALVIEAGSGNVLFEQNAHAIRYPASLTKMMTLYMVFEALDKRKLTLKQRLRVSSRAAERPPTNLRLKAGDVITVEEAIYALVTRSANDVATVVAEALGGTESNFARQMTRKARILGMQRTTFRNASGLPDPFQVTTAWDMFKLAKALQEKFPHYYHYFSTPDFAYGDRVYRNHNRLLADYPGTDGIKTGYIRASGYNLVASVKRSDQRLIGIVFGGDTGSERDAHMRFILSQSFARLGVEDPAGTLYADATPHREVRSFLAPKLDPIVLVSQGSIALVDTASKDFSDPEGYWKVQVGAFSYSTSAEQQIARAVESVPDMLFQTKGVIMPLLRGGRTLYRAWFKDLTQEEAADACRLLKQKRIDCVILPPTG